MNDEIEITETVIDQVRIVCLAGEFDTDEADAAAQGLTVPADGEALATVVDLSRVTFADSSFLHTLLMARLQHERAGRPFVLAGVSPLVQRLLDLTGTALAFTAAPHVPAAMDLARPDRP